MILLNMFYSNISAYCFLAINLGDCTPASTIYQDNKRTAKQFYSDRLDYFDVGGGGGGGGNG